MLHFEFKRDPKTNIEWIATDLTGKPLLNAPLLNKSTAFTEEERRTFGLLGKLPEKIETLEEQAERAYEQYRRYTVDFSRHIYLYSLHERSEVLFYKLVSDHLEEMLPIIYTPIVGHAVKQFSREFRATRGLYISSAHRNDMAEILNNRTSPEIDLMVVTDGSGVLGIGDQGVGAMDIPVAKLMVYTLCAGINPGKTLPIMLDVGTDNELLLNDPMYLGLRQRRITGADYDSFIDQFVHTATKQFPDAFLHWEDFGRSPAHNILQRYKNSHCTFNDDIQGTGAVALAAILAALKSLNTPLAEQRIIIFGAGAAGVGIADQMTEALVRQGMPHEKACRLFWLLNSQGLITDDKDCESYQRPYARPASEVAAWSVKEKNRISLEEVVRYSHPTIMIGTSAVAGAFTESIVKDMAQHTEHPIILPLSNPTDRSEAHPTDLLHWTNGKALIATGSPFHDVTYQNRHYKIAQSNNALVFPGIGLGVLAVRAKRLSDSMLWAACEALSKLSPIHHDASMPLLPPVSEARAASYQVAVAVATVAREEGLSRVGDDQDVSELIERMLWYPRYVPYKLLER